MLTLSNVALVEGHPGEAESLARELDELVVRFRLSKISQAGGADELHEFRPLR